MKELQDLEIDWEGVVLNNATSATGTVVVPEIECPLDDEALEELQRTVDPVGHSQSCGCDLYMCTKCKYFATAVRTVNSNK